MPVKKGLIRKISFTETSRTQFWGPNYPRRANSFSFNKNSPNLKELHIHCRVNKRPTVARILMQ